MQIIPIRAARSALAPAPRILPDDMDDLLVERARAHTMAAHCIYGTAHPYDLCGRQGDYARRLDALATQRGQE